MKFPFSNLLPQLTEEQEKERDKEMEKVRASLSDRLAMVGTAFVFLFLPCILILLVICGLAMLLF